MNDTDIRDRLCSVDLFLVLLEKPTENKRSVMYPISSKAFTGFVTRIVKYCKILPIETN
ncbi:MAG: hypothetical protein ACRC2R_18550 [Xenococcaceae cyanobacterium]